MSRIRLPRLGFALLGAAGAVALLAAALVAYITPGRPAPRAASAAVPAGAVRFETASGASFPAPAAAPGENYFLAAAATEARRLIGTPAGNLSVATTFDPRLQNAAETVVKHWLAGDGARRHVGQAALVAMTPDGAILAMVGGRDAQGANRATEVRHQAGSLSRVFVYLTALANGYAPDSPIEVPHEGRLTLQAAFARSSDAAAAQLTAALGADRVMATAKSLGVRSPLPSGPDLARGAAPVTLLEMTRAIDAIAADRKSIAPYTVRAIRAGAKPLYQRPDKVPPRPVWQKGWVPTMRLLEAVAAEGAGRKAPLADRKAAGLIGATGDDRDAWFVGFTKDFVVGVWVGNDDRSPMDKVAGGGIPAAIWHDFVTRAEQVLAQSAPTAATGSSAPERLAAAARPAAEAPIPPPTPAPAAQSPAPAAPVQGPVQGQVRGQAQLPAAAAPLQGAPLVIDSGTLLINGTIAHLAGIKGETGGPAHQLYQYIDGRQVTCRPAKAGPPQYHCRAGDFDLGEAVVLNGAGRAAANAPKPLLALQQKAREARRGIWAGNADAGAGR